MKKYNEEIQQKDLSKEDLLVRINELKTRLSILEDPNFSLEERAEEFERFLSHTPGNVKSKDGNKYVPIESIERELDNFFGLRWQTRNVKTELIINTITVTLELGVFHPIYKVWIWRAGAGAVQLQWQSRQKIKQLGLKYNITDVNQMIPNAIEKNFPAAKSRAIKNAAGFGRIFGRDINNKEERDINPIMEIIRQRRDIETKRRIEAEQLIKETGDRKSLDLLWKANVKTWNNDRVIVQMFKDRVKKGFPVSESEK